MTTLEDETTLEACLDAAGLIRIPAKNKSNAFLALSAPQVKMDDIQAVIRAERDED